MNIDPNTYKSPLLGAAKAPIFLGTEISQVARGKDYRVKVLYLLSY
jgi:hypothetical protein